MDRVPDPPGYPDPEPEPPKDRPNQPARLLMFPAVVRVSPEHVIK